MAVQGASAVGADSAAQTVKAPSAPHRPLKRTVTAAMEGERPWHGLAAGCVAGASGVLVGHAFDTAKVQTQVSGRAAPKLSFSSLYRGILPPLLSTGAMRSMYFGTYETFKVPVAYMLGAASSSALPVVFVTGCATGLATAPLSSPMQRLKLIQQVEGGSLRDCVRRLLATTGFRGLFRGLGLHCALETIGSGCYLTSYQLAKQIALGPPPPTGGSRLPKDEPLAVRIGCGAVGGICGWISIYPLDVLRSRVMSGIVTPQPCAVNGGAKAYVELSLVDMVGQAVHETYARCGACTPVCRPVSRPASPMTCMHASLRATISRGHHDRRPLDAFPSFVWQWRVARLLPWTFVHTDTCGASGWRCLAGL